MKIYSKILIYLILLVVGSFICSCTKTVDLRNKQDSNVVKRSGTILGPLEQENLQPSTQTEPTVEPPKTSVPLEDLGIIGEAGFRFNQGIRKTVSNSGAVAFLLENGQVLSWGKNFNGANISKIRSKLTGVKKIISNVRPFIGSAVSFAALKEDGTAISWGITDSTEVEGSLTNIKDIVANHYAFAALTNDGAVITWGDKDYGGDHTFSSNNVTRAPEGSLDSGVIGIYATGLAFAALKNDKTVVTWGSSSYGGNSSTVELTGITKIYGNDCAFAAINESKNVITWGDSAQGGNSDSVQEFLNENDIVDIYPGYADFAAITSEGTVVSWGRFTGEHFSYNVDSVMPSYDGEGFTVLKKDGTVEVWGESYYINDLSAVEDDLNTIGAKKLYYSSYNVMFALLKNDTLISWGESMYGGDSSRTEGIMENLTDVTNFFEVQAGTYVVTKKDGSFYLWNGDGTVDVNSEVSTALTNVENLYFLDEYWLAVKDNDGDGDNDVVVLNAKDYIPQRVNKVIKDVDSIVPYANYTMVVLKKDGSVETFGEETGGDTYFVKNNLFSIKDIYSTDKAFAALKSDGTVVTWGNAMYGGDSSDVEKSLVGVKTIYSNKYAFAALKEDGKVVSWGNSSKGGDNSAVKQNLVDVEKIVASEEAFAALTKNDMVVCWGNPDFGGEPSIDNGNVTAASEPLTGIRNIFANRSAFAALKFDNTIISWGWKTAGGNSAGKDLTDIVNIYSGSSTFIALKSNKREIISWGSRNWNKQYSEDIVDIVMDYAVITENKKALGLSSNFEITDVERVYSSGNDTFAFLKSDKTVVTKGSSSYGGNYGPISDVINVFSTRSAYGGAFAFLTSDKTVVTKGSSSYGGDSSSVKDDLVNVKTIVSCTGAFIAIKQDGSVVIWGYIDR